MKVADRLDLDDDQRYSLLNHHRARIEQLVMALRPALVTSCPTQSRGSSVAVMTYTRGRRSRRRRWFRFSAGWGTWCSNRWVALRDRWLWLRTLPAYRGAPER